jgi:hypothetical protein
MKKLLSIILLIMAVNYCQGQLFYFSVPNIHFIAEPGAGIDSRLYLGFTQANHGKAIISAEPPSGVSVIFQPDTLSESDTVIMSLMVTDTNLIGQNIPVVIRAQDSTGEINSTVYIKVVNEWAHLSDDPARQYLEQAINYLNTQYPNIITTYGNMQNFDWQGFWPYPPLLGISNYVFLTNNWRCNVLWHVMLPPYDWKKISIYNNEKNVCWGVYMDTDGKLSEIPCQKHYYFVQDTFALSVHDDEVAKQLPVVFPNPSSGQVFITLQQNIKEDVCLKIMNMEGQVVYEKHDLKVRESLDLSSLSDGIYFCRFQTKNKIETIKLAVQK